MLQSKDSESSEHPILAPSLGYILMSYASFLVKAVKRTSATRKDFSSLLFMFYAPLLYILGFGVIRSPLGFLRVANRETMRSFTYGFFKSHFFYLKDLKTLTCKSRFSVVLDIGANIGDFTLAMADATKKIVAVEPAKQNFHALKENIEINNLSNVVLVNVAVTEDEQDVFLQGNASDMYVAEDKKGELAEGTSLDMLAEVYGIEDVDVLKIDVQGHELSVLFGMHRLLLGKAVKLLIIEVHLRRGVRIEDVVSFMDEYRYRLVYKDNYFSDQLHLYFVPASNKRHREVIIG